MIGVSAKPNMHLVQEQVNSKMEEIKPLLAELDKYCSDTARIVRGEIELSVAVHYLRERIVKGIQKYSGSASNHAVPFTSDPCLFDVDQRVLKGTNNVSSLLYSRLTSLAAGTSISATIWVRALDGFVVSAGSMGINYPVKEYRKEDDPIRRKFSPQAGQRCISDPVTNQS